MPIVTQEWTHNLPAMQQTVLLTAIRGPDGVAKYHPCKFLVRWYRRCILVGALDHNVFDNPYDARGGSFTGPSYALTKNEEIAALAGEHDWRDKMNLVLAQYLQSLDELPHHFQLHFMHGAEILGYKHPDEMIRGWWYDTYITLVNDMHLLPETEETLDYRLGDSEAQWRRTSHSATQT